MKKLIREWKMITESIVTNNNSVFIHQENIEGFDGMIIDTNAFSKCVDLFLANKTYDSLAKTAIKAYIHLVKPDDPCNGALEVKKVVVANGGKGDLAYGMGYWLSQNSTLVPDRSAISDKAIAAWDRFSKKVQGNKLDDTDEPTNNDPNDDCQLWWGSEYGNISRINVRDQTDLPDDAADILNRSYTANVDKYDYSAMEHTGSQILSKLPAEDRHDFLSTYWIIANEIFERKLY